MKNSALVKALGAIVLVALLIAAVGAIVTARSYADCVSRIVQSAPPTDARPPATFVRLSRVFWGHRDLGLARRLTQECTSDEHKGMRRLGSQTFAVGVVKGRLSWPERMVLSSIFLPAQGGRGLTHSAYAEWGRPPASLSESEMAWLFVVGQEPSCSKQRPDSESDRKVCAILYQGRLDQLSSASKESGPGSSR
jgi:hypothetical protein